jgi:hypothetical protein
MNVSIACRFCLLDIDILILHITLCTQVVCLVCCQKYTKKT